MLSKKMSAIYQTAKNHRVADYLDTVEWIKTQMDEVVDDLIDTGTSSELVEDVKARAEEFVAAAKKAAPTLTTSTTSSGKLNQDESRWEKVERAMKLLAENFQVYPSTRSAEYTPLALSPQEFRKIFWEAFPKKSKYILHMDKTSYGHTAGVRIHVDDVHLLLKLRDSVKALCLMDVAQIVSSPKKVHFKIRFKLQ